MRTDRAVTTLAMIVAATFQTTAAQQPAWTAGGSAAAQYVSKATGDPTSTAGAVVELGSSTAAPNAFGTISVKLPADAYRGRRVRVVADVAASNVSGFAAPWVRADGPSGLLMIDNGQDKGLKGTANGQVEVSIVVPNEATTLIVGLIVSGTGEAKVNGLRAIAGPPVSNLPMSAEAKQMVDTVIALARKYSLWRDTVSWNVVEPNARALAGGATRTDETYPAIKYLLAHLGDHHSFHMTPRSTQNFTTGGAQNPRPEVKTIEQNVGYMSVPAYSGAEKSALETYARDAHAALEKVAPTATCGWVVDLRTNGGGNMWPMLNGLKPFFGNAGLGSFVSAAGSGPLWKAGDAVGVTPPQSLDYLVSSYVAVLTGPRTASSGEAVTISFRGRPNTRSFGQPTAGLSTANANYALPDGSMILLTTAVEADRTGKRYGEKIPPDEVIEAAAGAEDPQLAAALRWLRAQPACK